MSLPPNLENYVANAFNAKQGNFLSKRVFKLTYLKKKKIDWNGEEKDIPDQISATPSARSFVQKSSALLANKYEYDRMFSASVSAEYSGVTYSGSAASSLMYHGNMFSDSSSSYALNMYTQSVLTFERLGASLEDLDEVFVAALKKLPISITSQKDRQKYFDFFDAYGTHYPQLANVGGMIVMETAVKNALTRITSELEVTAAITAGYNGLVSKGKLSADSAYKSSDFLEKNRESIAVKISVEGGLFSEGENISDWRNSIYKTPILLLNMPLADGSVSQLKSIAELAEKAGLDQAISDNIKSTSLDYVIDDNLVDGVLGVPRALGYGTVEYDRLGDGFLIGQIRETNNGNRGYANAFADLGQNPSTMRACASQHYYTGSDTWVPYSSFIIPTPFNESSTATKFPTSGNPEYTLYHVGMGNINNSSFGNYESITDLNKVYNKPVDGFVVGYINVSSNGNRGYIEGRLKLNNEMATIAGSSVHYYTESDVHVGKNSFCMPVPANTDFQVEFVPTSGSPGVAFFFVPFQSEEIILGSIEERKENLQFQAKEDGFLMAFLDSSAQDGGRSNITLLNNVSQVDLEASPIASTSNHYYSGSDTWVPMNSAMIPVSKNSYYKAKYEATNNSPNVSVYWIPIIKGK